MNFSLSEEQLALREMSRELLATRCPSSRLRELWSGEQRDPQLWRSLAELGLTGLAIPESLGGSAGDTVDVVVVLEAAGRACLPEPLLETVGIAAPMLLACGDPQLRDRWLPAVAGGEAIVTVMLADQPYAPHADIADLLLVEVDGWLHAVEAEAFRATPVDSEDPTRRLHRVEHEAGRRVGDAEDARRLGALGTAAELNGVAAALLDMTLAYVKVREQFGVPVGSFQAVKHKLASVHATLESATAATRLAAYAVAEQLPDADLAVSVAKAGAVDAEQLANTEALQCFAGIGFTWEHDLHFWLKRGRALEPAYGSAAEHRARIAAILLDD